MWGEGLFRSCDVIDLPLWHRDQVWAYIKDKTGVANSSAFQQLDSETRCRVLKELKEKGASHRQLARLTGIGRSNTGAMMKRGSYGSVKSHR